MRGGPIALGGLVALASVALAACSFRISGTAVDADNGDGAGADDADVDVMIGLGDIAHVPEAVETEFAGTAALQIADAMLDTGQNGVAPMIDISLPPGARLITSAQDGGGPELAILEVGELAVTGVLAVRGSRPLVIVAATTITIASTGRIEASARANLPGPGGAGPRAGAGKGGDGTNDVASNDDSGGGGGGFGTAGSAGQASGPTTAGVAGPQIGDAVLTVLEGGSGGGGQSPNVCTTRLAGAGGGAIQLTAGTRVTIAGRVTANGGGGAGGAVCSGYASSGVSGAT